LADEQTTPEPQPTPVAEAPPSLVEQYEVEPEPVEATPAPPPPRSPGEAPAPPRARGADGRYLPRTEPDQPLTEPVRKPSQHLVNLALDLGLSEQEVAATPADALEVAVYHLTRQQLGRQREASIAQTINQATDRNLANEPAEPETSLADLGLNESNYNDDFVGFLKRMRKEHADEIRQLKEQVAHLQRAEGIRANESFAQKMDRLFAGDEGTFGKGDGRTLGEDSPELARRRAVLGVMQSLKVGTVEDKYAKAYGILYGQRQAEPGLDDELARRQDEWRRGNTARPTQRSNAGEPPGVEKATRGVRAKLAEMNGAADSGEASAEDFLGE